MSYLWLLVADGLNDHLDVLVPRIYLLLDVGSLPIALDLVDLFVDGVGVLQAADQCLDQLGHRVRTLEDLPLVEVVGQVL